MKGQPWALLSSKTPNETLPFRNGTHVRSGPHVPLRVRPGPRWNEGGWCGRSIDALIPIVSGWEPGAELSETICKQSDSEESDGATETQRQLREARRTLRGGRDKVHHPSVRFQEQFRASQGRPVAQPGCESGALEDNPTVWPDFTSQELTPSEENSGVPAGDELELPCSPSGRAPTNLRELWGHSPERMGLGGTPKELPSEDALHLQLVRESLRPQHAPGAAPGRAHPGKAPCV